ncbi:MAG: hypothetical protein GY835_23845 [bacterium]|nr:hypothetical protein [bacterium]
MSHSLDDLKPGHKLIIQVPRTGGDETIYVGEFVEATPTEIIIRAASWVRHTGRNHVFYGGVLDDSAEVEQRRCGRS